MQNETITLNAVVDHCRINSKQTGTSDVAFERRYDLELRMPSEKDHDYANIPNVTELSEYKQAAISYIASFVVKMVQNKVRCPECVGALAVSRNTHSDIPFVFFIDLPGHEYKMLVKVSYS